MEFGIGDGHTINQHYVPQFFLSRFSDPQNNQVYVFDKQRNVKFRTGVRNILAERRFYDFKIGEKELTLENWLCDIEAAAANVLASKISRDRGVRDLTQDDRVVLARFVAVQIARTKNERLDQLETFRKYKEILTGKFPPEAVATLSIEDERNSDAFFAKSVAESGFMVPYLLNKKWVYHYTSQDLYISDNPITMVNAMPKESPHRGNLGLDVKGIEIYFPISSREVIVMICEKLFAEMELTFDADPAGTDRSSDFRIRNFVNSVRRKIPTEMPEETILNHNSSQLAYAERFVLCEHDDFWLVEDMIRDPKLRSGPRTQIG